MPRSIWQFRGVGTEIEAFVLADDYDPACELFQAHLRVHDGDPDTLLFRQLEMDHLDSDAAVVVREALVMERDGLVAHDEKRGWVFITPLGDRSSES
jgi:hypothetical protein